jgi:hypothetical protein
MVYAFMVSSTRRTYQYILLGRHFRVRGREMQEQDKWTVHMHVLTYVVSPEKYLPSTYNFSPVLNQRCTALYWAHLGCFQQGVTAKASSTLYLERFMFYITPATFSVEGSQDEEIVYN